MLEILAAIATIIGLAITVLVQRRQISSELRKIKKNFSARQQKEIGGLDFTREGVAIVGSMLAFGWITLLLMFLVHSNDGTLEIEFIQSLEMVIGFGVGIFFGIYYLRDKSWGDIIFTLLILLVASVIPMMLLVIFK